MKPRIVPRVKRPDVKCQSTIFVHLVPLHIHFPHSLELNSTITQDIRVVNAQRSETVTVFDYRLSYLRNMTLGRSDVI